MLYIGLKYPCSPVICSTALRISLAVAALSVLSNPLFNIKFLFFRENGLPLDISLIRSKNPDSLIKFRHLGSLGKVPQFCIRFLDNSFNFDNNKHIAPISIFVISCSSNIILFTFVFSESKISILLIKRITSSGYSNKEKRAGATNVLL